MAVSSRGVFCSDVEARGGGGVLTTGDRRKGSCCRHVCSVGEVGDDVDVVFWEQRTRASRSLIG